jgi:putative membrane protein
MKILRKIITVLIVLATLAVGMLFALQNKTMVPLDLLVYSLEPRSIALWVLSAFAIGGLLGMLACSTVLLRQRASIGAANRRLAKSRAEVGRLRDTPADVAAQ